VPKSFQDWIREGEELYNAAFQEYQNIEAQLDELEKQLAAKQMEVNQIAHMIGKPPVEGNRRLTAQIVEPERANPNPSSPANIARALTGRQMGR
jgi:chromosome segregation ATPase